MGNVLVVAALGILAGACEVFLRRLRPRTAPRSLAKRDSLYPRRTGGGSWSPPL
jgi:hypothetical protein